MPAVCLYFQVHQPYRLAPYSYFNIGSVSNYFDDALNASVMQRIAERCYLPTNAVLLDIIKRFRGDFRIAFSISGVAIEQMRRYAPEALASFQALAASDCVEFLTETYHHSLAALFDREEFAQQVELHRDLMHREFQQRSSVFRNTELLYSDEIGRELAVMGMRAVLVEGVDRVLRGRSPHLLYSAAGAPLTLITRNYRLSDDIAFRFESGGESGGTLSVERYVERVRAVGQEAQTLGVFLDYETFGEHVGYASGIHEFLRTLPGKILALPGWRFSTPTELVEQQPLGGDLSFPDLSSWADTERDATAWTGNRMQQKALSQLYSIAQCVKGAEPASQDEVLDIWRRLQTSDHFYYMATKDGPDGVVHEHFSPFESAYRAFIAYSNVLRDFKSRFLADR